LSGELGGVGLSLVSVPRFAASLERWGSRLETRIFCPGELAYASRKRDPAHNLAARFAAKCAGRAALASLGARGVALRDLEVTRRRSGEPTLAIREGAAVDAPALRFVVSITHDADLAMASLWVEVGPGGGDVAAGDAG
jgi:holo-[acyl-carrier protein] synthase